MMTKFPLKMPLFMGKGTRQTTEELLAQTSPEACVAAIGLRVKTLSLLQDLSIVVTTVVVLELVP